MTDGRRPGRPARSRTRDVRRGVSPFEYLSPFPREGALYHNCLLYQKSLGCIKSRAIGCREKGSNSTVFPNVPSSSTV